MSDRLRTLAAVLLLGTLVQPVAWGVTFVDADATGADDGSSWANAYTRLGDALAATASGQIWVAAGTYRPGGPGERRATFRLRRGVAILGGFAGTETAVEQRDPVANPTILSGDLLGDDFERWANGHFAWANVLDNSWHVVTAEGPEGSGVLSGVVISHGAGYGPAVDFSDVVGAGLLVRGAAPLLLGVRFDGNGGQFGAAVGVLDGSVLLVGCELVHNYVDIGAGGAIYGDATSRVLVVTSSFRENASIGSDFTAGRGGAIATEPGSTLLVDRSAFVANFAGFRTNLLGQQPTRGGAVSALGDTNLVFSSRFVGNRAHLGGALDIAGLGIVRGSAFSGNEAHEERVSGLAPAGAGGAVMAAGTALLIGNTVGHNRATDTAGGIYVLGEATIANSILFGNTAAVEEPTLRMQIHHATGAQSQIAFSLVEGLFAPIPGEDPVDPADVPGSIDADPRFVLAAGVDGMIGTADDDLRLDAGSPAVDAGHNGLDLLDLDGRDLAGGPRRKDDPAVADTGVGPPPVVDMGAYER
ncbi:MAG: hypothetical protein H6983_05565 [Ectothiorhodospiraceae bacterium]|nr:hypothetical protein [Chromatiales bacterium]MCP5153610.1 hypothetical protein [Ectothiorhodospiraceae bacterium]